MYRIVPLLLLSLFLLPGCANREKKVVEQRDFAQILASDTITAVTLYGSTTYFLYKMQAMGYEYDLIHDFANQHNLKLNMLVADNIDHLMEMLESGEADVAAYPLQVTSLKDNELLFCGQENLSTQVLVQRADRGDTLLTNVTQLIGKEVYVRPSSRYAERLNHLDDELGGGIIIREMPADSASVEDLIEMVSKGEIPYTVTDDYIARLNKTYFWNIYIDLPVSFMQRTSWAVRKNSPVLAKAINEWADDNEGKRIFKATVKRYFELSKHPAEAEMPPVKNGHISPYDDLFRKHAAAIQWDWQLLASISYQESRFDPNVVSWVGAEGLMGIMPNTARALGVTPHELKDPEVGIRTGVECLRRFRQGFSAIEDNTEKIKFVLASYNAGIGHVYDAQKLTEKYGKNPLLWEDVSEYIRLKSDPEYYNDPVCKHGYLRGSETFDYVDEVMNRYVYYKQKTKK